MTHSFPNPRSSDFENKVLAYKPRTPTQLATILPLGFSGDVSPALRAVIDCADNAQVLISRHEEAVVVRPNEMFLTARGMTIVDRMKSIRHATELLAQCGLSEDDFQKKGRASCRERGCRYV